MRLKTLTVLGLIAAATCGADAHDGRRFEVMIVDGKLVARGYHSAGIDDGAGVQRPYYNALHHHWAFLNGVEASTADLPGFDVITPGALEGHDLSLTFHGVSRWRDVPVMPPNGTVPEFEPLDPAHTLFVTFDTTTVSSEAPGDLVIAQDIGGSGALDLDLSFDINTRPVGEIYVLEFTMSTDAPGVASSDTVYILLSPDGANGMEKRHHASLFLEAYLGTPIEGLCAADLADSTGFGAPDGIVDFGDFFALSFLAGPCGHGTSNHGCAGDLADASGFGPPDGLIDFGDFFAMSFAAGPCP